MADENRAGSDRATAAGRVFFVGFPIFTPPTTSGLAIFEVERDAPSTQLVTGTFNAIGADAGTTSSSMAHSASRRDEHRSASCRSTAPRRFC